MINDNILIKFHGMIHQRSEQLEDYLDSLLRHSPSKSTCHMHVFKESSGYLCKLTVHSNIKVFSSQFKSDQLPMAVKNVLKDVKGQVAKWKKNRSSMDLTGVVEVATLNLQILGEEVDSKANKRKTTYKQVA